MRLCGIIAIFAMVFPGLVFADATEEKEEKPAKMQVRGYGILGNLALKRALDLIVDAEEEPQFFTATQIEDGALLLLAQVREDGYLRPVIETTLTLENGETETFRWEENGFTVLPRPLKVRRAVFRIQKGNQYYYETLDFQGLTVLTEEEASDYFIATGFLIETRKARIFTPDRLNRGIGSLREILMGKGYEGAEVYAADVVRDDETGGVSVRIGVEEGPISLVRSARAIIDRDGGEMLRDLTIEGEEPFSRSWVQDRAQQLRAEFYEEGYPDVKVTSQVEHRDKEGDTVWIDYLFRVEPGPYVELGEVVFEGIDKTKESVLRRRVDLDTGEALDRGKVDAGRSRISRLGIFEKVNVEFEDVSEGVRNVIYVVEEGKELDVNLLLGYGSYEMVRAGIELEQYNIFGRAHRSRLLLTQSMRSSGINYRYTVPELFGEDIHGFGTFFGLRREEKDFDRREFGASVGAQTYFYRADIDAGLRYTYQLLESRAGLESGPDGLDRAFVSAIDLTLQRDRRDNPIYPEKGYHVRTMLEVASDALGGEVEYQRFEISGSYHHHFGRGFYVHVGLQHGILTTTGTVADQIPINRRFFMGGESTVRGYLEGEASPRNEDDKLVGSETFALLNIELEQALTQRWSVVLFSDSIGFSRRIDDYPFDESLFSVGLGIRYKTLIGPLRLEYGRNINPRERDPSGALHFSIGFPF